MGMTMLFNAVYLNECSFSVNHCMKTLYKNMCSESEAVVIGMLSCSPTLLLSWHQGRSKSRVSGSWLTGDDQQQNSNPAFHLGISVALSAFIVQISRYIEVLLNTHLVR